MMLDGKNTPSFQEKKKDKMGDSVFFPDEEDAFDAPLLFESRDKTSSRGARKLLKKCRNGLDDLRFSLHSSSTRGLKTFDESFSESPSESFESSIHSARDDPTSTKNSSDPPRSSAKADRKLMKTCKKSSDEMMSSIHASDTSLASNVGSVASFLEDSSESSDSFADAAGEEDTAQASDNDDNDGSVSERSYSNLGGQLHQADLSGSESGLLEGGGANGTDILQLSFSVGGGCTLRSLECRPDDSNTTEASPKVRRSSSFNKKIPGNQNSSRKDSNTSRARIDDFSVDASSDRRLLRRCKSNDGVLSRRSSQLSDNSEKDGRKLRRCSSADKLLSERKTSRRRDSSDKTNAKFGREGLTTSSTGRRSRSSSADKIEPARRSIHSDGKLSRRSSIASDKLVGRTTIEKQTDDGSDNEPDKDDLEPIGGRRRSRSADKGVSGRQMPRRQNSFVRRPRRRAEVARVLQPSSSFNEKTAERPVRRLPARAASSRCLMSSRSEPLRGSRLSVLEECADHSKLIRAAPSFQRPGRGLQRAQSFRTVIDPSRSSARLYAPEVNGLD
jgi:hypothetical protein